MHEREKKGTVRVREINRGTIRVKVSAREGGGDRERER